MTDDRRSLRDLEYCVVDTETTGGSAEINRIIEVAAFHYRDGIILDRFQTLINPGISIPAWITALTGIDDGMVEKAPTFAEVAPRLRQFLSRGIFVAHNAPFDYSFIRHEFMRLGEMWQAPTLCTVRMARRLFPDLPSRSLGNLCDHLLIDIYDRHRASGDAEATVYVLKHCLKLVGNLGVATWADLQSCLSSTPLKLPEGITLDQVEALPECAGRIIFRDAKGDPIYTGKSANIRKRVRTLFRASNQSTRSAHLRQVVRSIETVLDLRRRLSQLADAIAPSPAPPATAHTTND